VLAGILFWLKRIYIYIYIHTHTQETATIKTITISIIITIIKFERVENFKYLGVILNEDNNNQIDLQERIKSANKTYFMLQKFF
jgi:hypothetical protein